MHPYLDFLVLTSVKLLYFARHVASHYAPSLRDSLPHEVRSATAGSSFSSRLKTARCNFDRDPWL